jgi:hypothetical protein
MRPTRPILVGLVLASALATGCGDDADPPAPATARTTATTTTVAAGMPLSQYVAEFTPVRQSIEDAKGDFLTRAKGTKADLRTVRDAYASALETFQAVEPPAVAAAFHARVLALWGKRVDALDAALRTKPYTPSAGSRVLQGTSDREGAVYDEVYVMPQ